jgi:hypothetical protein
MAHPLTSVPAEANEWCSGQSAWQHTLRALVLPRRFLVLQQTTLPLQAQCRPSRSAPFRAGGSL